MTLSVTDSSSQTSDLHLRFLVPSDQRIAARLGRRHQRHLAHVAAPSQELLSARRSPAITPRSTPPAARSTPRSTCRATTRTSRALALTYDSVDGAIPNRSSSFENTIAATVPSQVSAQLTFNGGTPLTTYYYDTQRRFNPGDVQQIALQATNATSLATGRYTYSAQVVDIGIGEHDHDLQRRHESAQLLEQRLRRRLDAARARADHLRVGRRDPRPGRRWPVALVHRQRGSGGGTYTDPAGEFSTLVEELGRAATPAR